MLDQINQWKTENQDNLPDFIIGGAMKSGTTSLHQILSKHPDIYMADGEIGFFDLDNILEHPDFNFFDGEQWHIQDISKNPCKAWKWYFDKFQNGKNKIKGEDSTTYLASSIAAERIAFQDKKIKMIFMLRHPTARTISNYFHLLKSGRAEYNLEDTLQYNPQSIIRRSLYKSQLEVYYKHLHPRQIKIVLFEDFIDAPKNTIKEICEFLNISFEKFKVDNLRIHSNKTLYPKYQNIQLIYNRFNRSLGKKRYSNSLPIKNDTIPKELGFKEKFLKKIHKKINPKSEKYKPIIKPATKDYLDNFFKKEMEGIDELTSMNIYNKWFSY